MPSPKYVFTAAMDAEITKSYQENVSSGGNRVNAPRRALSERLGIPRSTISARAAVLGIIPTTRTSKAWSDEELTILEHHAHKSLHTIKYHLKRKGYARSLSSIRHCLNRSNLLKNLKGQSATSLALCFNVKPTVVTGWIRRGHLKAKRRGTARTTQQGGDAWFITDRQVRDFIVRYIEVIDFRKIDKYWLVDLLAGGYYGLGPIADEYKSESDDDFVPEELSVELANLDHHMAVGAGAMDWV